MRINKDLADAIMMVSFIVLVLVGTTTFDNEVTKNVTMGSLGVITVAMLVLRVIGSRQKEEDLHYNNLLFDLGIAFLRLTTGNRTYIPYTFRLNFFSLTRLTAAAAKNKKTPPVNKANTACP